MLIGSFSGWAQGSRLSPQAQISLITGSPGQDLYTLFGHSGLRVYDPATRMDIMFNYGTFDFDTPNFYLKFVRGRLDYFLSISDYPSFVEFYTRSGRAVYEQVLRLSPAQKEKLFAFLQENYKLENRFYRYDFFYDNCATRIRDALIQSLGADFAYNASAAPQPRSFRQWVDPYLSFSWVRLGIYLLLGSPADKMADGSLWMFLPDNLKEGLAKARIRQEGQWKPAALPTKDVYAGLGHKTSASWLNPYLILPLICAVTAILLVFAPFRLTQWVDFTLFLLMGLVGVFFLLMWLGTDHNATKSNLNLLWAWPSHLVFAFYFLGKSPHYWSGRYFGVFTITQAILMAGWSFWPQSLHGSLLALTTLLMWRALRYYLRSGVVGYIAKQ
ncbi:MAG: DUF4105 domain-containing protein [Microscillaceae bacterium]